MHINKIFFLTLLLLKSIFGYSQVRVHGKITNVNSKLPITGANIKNIYTGLGMSTDSTGKFSIECKPGELMEISHVSYNTARVRIKSDINLFYNIILEPKSKKLQEAVIRDHSLNYTVDSIATAEKYQLILAQPSFDDYDLKNGIIGMLSKQQRQKWAFIEMMNVWEKEKYIDYMFNEKKIARWTKMPPDMLESFMRRYRPSYDFVRNSNQYTFMKYIKDCVAIHCPQCEFMVR